MQPDQPFRVVASVRVSEQIRELLQRLNGSARYEQARAAIREVMRLLARNPLSLGEGLGHLQHLRLLQRIEFNGPLVIRFAVSVELRTVWLQSVRLYPTS